MRYFIKLIFISLGIFLLIGTLANGQQPVETKQVLILITGEKGVPGYVLAEEGMRASLDSRTDISFEYFTEYMDRYRFKDVSYQNDLLDLYRTKYSNKKLDFIIAYGYHALDFALNHGEDIFPLTPIVFSAVMGSQLKRLHLDKKITGSLLKIDYLGLLNTALKNHPGTRHIAIITGSAKVDQLIEGQCRKAYKPYLDQYNFIYLGQEAMPDLIERLAKLPKHTVAIYFHLALDGKGEAFKPWEVASMVSKTANAPVYGLADTYMGHGIVGGRLLSYAAHGRKAGEIGLRILDGENPADIPISAEGTILDMFDWRQLKRWGINDSTLPEGSILLYKERSFWGQYLWYTIGGICVIFIQGLFITRLISIRKKGLKKEQELRASEERYKALIKNSTEDIYCFELEHPLDVSLPVDEQIDHLYKYVYLAEANDAWARLVGYDRGKDLIGIRFEDILPRSKAESIATLKKLISMQYRLDNHETLEIYKNGIKRWVSNSVTGIIEKGRLVRIWGTGRDITELKTINEKLHEAEQKYRTVADFTYDWEYWQAPDGSLIYVSPSCERITGYDTSELMKHPELLSEMILLEDKEIWKRHSHVFSAEKKEDASHIHFRIYNKSGDIHWIAHVCRPVYNQQGDYVGIRASNRDITDLRLAENKIREHRELMSRMERRETLGQLTGSIAHELNQPLTGILSHAQAGELLLQQGELDRAQTNDIFTDIITDTKRASRVIRNLRDLFNKKKIEMRSFNISGLISDTLRVLNSEFIDQGVTIKTDISTKLPNLTADKVQIQQVLINLINNALQAFPHTVNTDRWVSLRTMILNNDEVVVCLDDNGPGIDPDRLQSIFEPLVTTKEDGMGMGLAISKSIVQSHGGRIWAENTPQGGARFSFSLPLRR